MLERETVPSESTSTWFKMGWIDLVKGWGDGGQLVHMRVNYGIGQVFYVAKMSGKKKILGKWRNVDSYAEEEIQNVGNTRVDVNREYAWVD